ncbi:MAG: hypothetical protein B7X90_13375 [Novosphingobium sp. 17-62-19]|uniref:GNAT family N-acetyltransferase n=1 Tax=Novosphingobium sp. 17-62-19 TaxID=1970406 RepID=UPI000BD275ED|nr:GNAT family N-acetyltransferase [Novosphingobium sp. 17-62-19]OYX94484.1 MAG: hypothetical protein B7Y74_06925 [Novosphingobium sp. 35-62-5]OZA17931.1 MAG: hypothetical protein B7X90_13375 [Novosphingobium sp. 17-62-19]OZA61055.1 MAG: hypothetical protein B7X78_07690 [Sphingomonadales bacterium 39-62-4]
MQMSTPSVSIRRFARSDLAAALIMQSQIYPAFLVEDEVSFASHIDLPSSYCLVASVGGQVAGYLLAHGWPRNSPPQLGTPLIETEPAEILYIHDLAVAPACRGHGVGQRLVGCAFDLAISDGLTSAELVAVEGAASFWQAMGFAGLDTTPAIEIKLASYGRGANWMGRGIG